MCCLFVEWLDGCYPANAKKGLSIYQSEEPVSRLMGHMEMAKTYGTGDRSSYEIIACTSSRILAPVCLLPDFDCQSGKRYFAIKNDDLAAFDQNAA